MLFFAYDDRMFEPILRLALPQYQVLQLGYVEGYKLYFHRYSESLSGGKANMIRVDDSEQKVYGLLIEVPPRQKYLLDEASSLGYGVQETSVKVMTEQGAQFALTYVCHKDNVMEDLVPFSWYKDLLVAGAKNHQLPLEYIHHLENYASQVDQNSEREAYYRSLLKAPFTAT